MITKDTAKSGDTCCICDRTIPNSVVVLKKVENGHIICILCLVEIAEIAKSERT